LRKVLILPALVGSALALEWLPQPYLWIALIWIALLAIAVATGACFRVMWFNVASVLAVLACVEGWFAYGDRFRMEGHDPGQYIDSDHGVLGYAPYPDQQVRARRMYGDEVVYDVRYTIGSDGLRVAPPVAEDGGDQCILFFGGSFTFGEGVGDAGTLPYQTGLKTGGRYRVYNFGFHGYGPHQMLAALQSDFVDQRIDCKPRFVIYQGIWFHAFRSAGLELWDRHGPRYQKPENRPLERSGHFDDNLYLDTRRQIFQRLYRSSLFSYVHQRFRRPNLAAKKLYLAILEEVRHVVESRYPGCEFHILFWDEPWLPMEQLFEQSGFRLHRVGRILPAGWRADRTRYQVHALDLHPNASALGKLAEYVAELAVSAVSASD
jgi:hypothetical protein